MQIMVTYKKYVLWNVVSAP